MIKIDSLKLKFNINTVKDIEFNNFLVIEKKDNNKNLLAKKFILDTSKNNNLGLKNIELVCDLGLIEYGVIELSAKVLRQDYFDLINRNNIEKVIDTINSFNIIEFNKNRFIDNAEVLRADVTDNLIVSKEVSDYIRALRFCKINNKYRTENYGSEAIVFKRNVSSYKERMIFYNKFTEMLKDKEAKFLGIDKFKNVLRCENNITSFSRLRKVFEIEPYNKIYLKDILNSNKQVNYETFNRIVNTDNLLSARLFSNEFQNMQLRQIEKRLGQECIISKCEFDLNKISEFLKLHTSSKTRMYDCLKEYKKVLLSMQSERDIESQQVKYIKEIKELLRVA